MTHRILVVDDEEAVRWALKKALEREGFRVAVAADGDEGFKLAQDPEVALAFWDVRLPGVDGLDALSRLREVRADLPVIIMTAYGTLSVAVEAMKRGAFDYIAKPFDLEEPVLLARKALEVRALNEEVERLRVAAQGALDFGGIVGASPAMQKIFRDVGKVAATDLTVLVRGESGTGKELIARAIHANSRRVGRPFTAVNCAAIPRELLESELFGYERGAFTGATASRRGKFEQADGGTLFLDEIGDMDLSLQTKILRILQERQIERLGGEGTIPVDVRIIAATNQDLEAAVARRAFREDLLFRLNVMAIVLPPLRDRREDIPLLASHFLHQFAADQGEAPKVLSPETMGLLLAHAWPGNVRELENAVKRAAALATTSVILPEHLPIALQPEAEGGGTRPEDSVLDGWVRAELRRVQRSAEGRLYAHFLERLERPLLEAILAQAGGNQVRAASLLGINRNTLRKKLTGLGIVWGRREKKVPAKDPNEPERGAAQTGMPQQETRG